MKNLTTVQKAMFLIVLPIISILLIIASGIGAYSYSQSSKKAEIDSAVAKVEKEQNTAKETTLYGAGVYQVGTDVNKGSYYVVLVSGKEVTMFKPDWTDLNKDKPFKINLKKDDIIHISSTNDDEKVEIKLIPADKYKPSDN